MKHLRKFVPALGALVLAVFTSASHAGGWTGNSSWGETSGSTNDGYNVSGWTRDKDAYNGNCVKLKQGQYDQVPASRTCSGHVNWFNASLPYSYLALYLYEENSNRTVYLTTN